VSDNPSPSPSSAAETDKATPPGPARTTPPAAQGIRLDIGELKSSYCNICNANSTREEVVLNFGVTHDWDRGQNGELRLLHRIILSPQAAKRFAGLLNRVIQDYETRHGSLS
jgi:hypothetical protein